MAGATELLFVPFAMKDWDSYTAHVAAALLPLGLRIRGIHSSSDPRADIQSTARVFVGGGNTFRLLNEIQQSGLLGTISELVASEDSRYMGSSAGTNIAAPTIRTTNDMPIVYPATLKSLGLVDFQINPHYLDPIVGLAHMGESREARLQEYLEENDCPVLGIREGALLRGTGHSLTLNGGSARLFRRGQDPLELLPSETDLVPLMAGRAPLCNQRNCSSD